jgi:transcriptional regulator with XRE-family HTH domain
MTTDPWGAQVEALGAYIRQQRQLANLSLRQLADLTTLSNPYLSQIERGLHEPSVRVLKLIADALDLSTEALLAHAGLVDESTDDSVDEGTDERADQNEEQRGVEAAIRAEDRLSGDQQKALIAVFRSMVGDDSAQH